MIKMVEKHAGSIKWAGTLLIPTVLMSFWLGIGTLYGQDPNPNTTGIASPGAALPTIGTSLTAGGVFFMLMSFLQRTIDRYEAEKKEIHNQWNRIMETAAMKADSAIALAHRDRDAAYAKYHEMVADIMDDTKSLRLGQPNTPKPRRQP